MPFWTEVRHFLMNVRNGADYPLRQFFRWRRGNLRWVNEPKDALFSDLPSEERKIAEARAQNFLETYRLQPFHQNSRERIYRESLYYLALLEEALTRGRIKLKEEITCADIGPSDWFYVQALYALLRWYDTPKARTVTLHGFERDAFRVYADFYSRYDHALSHLAGLQGVTYFPHPFEAKPKQYDLIFLLFPFVFLEDHLRWGLPKSIFDPVALLNAVWQSLKGDGGLVIANQGRAEHEVQQRLMQIAGIPIQAAFIFNSPLYRYTIDRYVLVAIHP